MLKRFVILFLLVFGLAVVPVFAVTVVECDGSFVSYTDDGEVISTGQLEDGQDEANWEGETQTSGGGTNVPTNGLVTTTYSGTVNSSDVPQGCNDDGGNDNNNFSPDEFIGGGTICAMSFEYNVEDMEFQPDVPGWTVQKHAPNKITVIVDNGTTNNDGTIDATWETGSEIITMEPDFKAGPDDWGCIISD